MKRSNVYFILSFYKGFIFGFLLSQLGMWGLIIDLQMMMMGAYAYDGINGPNILKKKMAYGGFLSLLNQECMRNPNRTGVLREDWHERRGRAHR
jgi:hypothetical protein